MALMADGNCDQKVKKAFINDGPCRIAWLGRVFYAEHRLRLAGQ